MDAIEALLNVLARLRADLPDLVGDDWPVLDARLAELITLLQADSSRAPLVRAWILDLCEPYPLAVARLRTLLAGPADDQEKSTRGFEHDQSFSSSTINTNPRNPFPESVDSHPFLTRYTDIACPRRVGIDTPRVPVVLRLTMLPAAYSAATEALTLRPNLPVRVMLHAPAFQLLSPAVQEILLLPEADSPPVVFDLKPQQVGHTNLTFDFFQGSDPAGTATVPVEITAYEVGAGLASAPAGTLHFPADVTPPDLVLHIATHRDPPTLTFTLIREGGASMQTFAPVSLSAAPAAFANELYRKIAKVGKAQDPTVAAILGKSLQIPREDAERRIRQLGQNLWREVIPGELKTLYAQEREAWRDRTLLVLSDEPHLPWELVWPYEANRYEDETPWCQTLHLTRWLRKDAQGNGNARPPARLRLRSLAVLAPAYSKLPYLPSAQRELADLQAMIRRHGLRDVSPSAPTWGAVLDLLEAGGYDLLHAAAHGNFYPAAPDADSALWLESDTPLTPDAVVGPRIEGYLHAQRPAFFFNACQVGRQDWSLTRIGGWANRLISSGAGLFIGPLWEVSDPTAYAFSLTFYTALLDGATLAAATREGRIAARRQGDPTWLAYSVYGHPNATVVTA